ncbi:hypothetical protein HUJ04_008951 [Dendroctonus ponderosae]|nr:hypothetical protein HUJ04_008951 [Dendroctonus ponderosae]
MTVELRKNAAMRQRAMGTCQHQLFRMREEGARVFDASGAGGLKLAQLGTQTIPGDDPVASRQAKIIPNSSQYAHARSLELHAPLPAGWPRFACERPALVFGIRWIIIKLRRQESWQPSPTATIRPIISVKFHHKHTGKVRASSEQPWNKTLKLLIISHLVCVEEHVTDGANNFASVIQNGNSYQPNLVNGCFRRRHVRSHGYPVVYRCWLANGHFGSKGAQLGPEAVKVKHFGSPVVSMIDLLCLLLGEEFRGV